MCKEPPTTTNDRRRSLAVSGGPIVEPGKLTTILTWVGTGFALLAGIATFFGIQGGVLARIVRTYPAAVITVFIFVGLAVVIALVLPGVSPKDEGNRDQVPLWLLILVLLVVALATSVVAPELPGPDSESTGLGFTWLLVLVGVVVLVLSLVPFHRKAWPPKLTWFVTFLVLAVFSLGSGLYVAMKLSVIEATRLDVASVTSSVKVADGLASLDLTVTGTELAGPVRFRIMGQRTGTADEVEIVEQLLMPTRAGALNSTTSIPIPGRSWASIRVLTCQEWNTSQRQNCDPQTEQASFALEHSTRGLGGSLTQSDDGKRVVMQVTGTALPPDGYLMISAGAVKPGGSTVTARVRPAADGSVSWSTSVPVATATKWQLKARICETSDVPASCATDYEEIASYTAPSTK